MDLRQMFQPTRFSFLFSKHLCPTFGTPAAGYGPDVVASRRLQFSIPSPESLEGFRQLRTDGMERSAITAWIIEKQRRAPRW